jgi:hypothetical protein
METFLEIIKENQQLRIIKFNDNPFNKDHIDPFFKRLYPYLDRLNGNAIQERLGNYHSAKKLEPEYFNKFAANLKARSHQISFLRQMLSKMMSSKIRINYFATTDIMRFIKSQFSLLAL